MVSNWYSQRPFFLFQILDLSKLPATALKLSTYTTLYTSFLRAFYILHYFETLLGRDRTLLIMVSRKHFLQCGVHRVVQCVLIDFTELLHSRCVCVWCVVCVCDVRGVDVCRV